MAYGYIYETKNQKNSKLYVGRKRGEFKKSYFGGGRHLQRAIKKDGKENFSVRIIAEATSEDHLNQLEIQTIREYREKHGRDHLYNIADGGYPYNVGWHFSEESKKKLSESIKAGFKAGRIPWAKGKKHSEEQRQKNRIGHLGLPSWNKGRHYDEAAKRKMSEASKGRIPWIAGKHHTEEARQKIKAKRALQIIRNGYKTGRPAWNRGISPSMETRQKLSAALKGRSVWMTGRHHSAATKLRISRNMPRLSASGIRGVYWIEARQNWEANIRVNGILKWLGNFKTREEAAKARADAVEKYFQI